MNRKVARALDSGGYPSRAWCRSRGGGDSVAGAVGDQAISGPRQGLARPRPVRRQNSPRFQRCDQWTGGRGVCQILL